MATRTDAPTVFISYSWSSVAHENWVLELAEKLMSDGVDVILDKWDLQEGQDKHAFMEKMVTDEDISRVLIICDSEYQEKADGRHGGVGTESQIISKEIYTSVDQKKFIPLLRESDEKGEPCVPVYLGGRIYFDFTHDESFYQQYEKLLRNIFDRPLVSKPELGVPPAHLFQDEQPSTQIIHKASQFRDAFIRGTPNAKSLFSEFLHVITNQIKSRDLDKAPNEPDFDEAIIQELHRTKPYRDDFIRIWDFLQQNSAEDNYTELLLEWLERAIPHMLPQPGVSEYYEFQFDATRFFLYELFLYIVAIMIRRKQFDNCQKMLSTDFYFSSFRGKEHAGYGIFNHYLESLNKIRNNRLNLRRISLSADIIHERADTDIGFLEILQADLILAIRLSLKDSGGIWDIWYPHTLVYSSEVNGPLDIFHRARSQDKFETLSKLLGISKKGQLVELVQDPSKKRRGMGWTGDYRRVPLERLMNLDELYTE